MSSGITPHLEPPPFLPDLVLPERSFAPLGRFPGRCGRLNDTAAAAFVAEVSHRAGANVIEPRKLLIPDAKARLSVVPIDRSNFRVSLQLGNSFPDELFEVRRGRKAPLQLVFCLEAGAILLGRASGAPAAAWRLLTSEDRSAHQRLALRVAIAAPAARLFAALEPRRPRGASGGSNAPDRVASG